MGHRKAADGRALRVVVISQPGIVADGLLEGLHGVAELEVLAHCVPPSDATADPDVRAADVVLIDAEATGRGVRRLVRELADGDTRAVMVLSWDRDGTQVREAILAGARGYLTKDMSAPAIGRAIDGTRRGELAMSRRMAAALVRDLASHRARATGLTAVDPALARLSARELEVMGLLATGMKDREIAEALSLSVRTVETHVLSILRRLEVSSRREAAQRYAAAAPGDGAGAHQDSMP